MKISTILHRAADFHLPTKLNTLSNYNGYSCMAIYDAIDEAVDNGEIDRSDACKWYDMIDEGLRNLGLEPGALREFDEFNGHERQPARFQWLKFVAFLAEEQGD